MFLTKTKRSPFYQIIYFNDGKQTSKSTQTTDRKKAEIILEAFNRSIIELPEIPYISSSIRLRKFSQEYIDLFPYPDQDAILRDLLNLLLSILLIISETLNLEI